MNVNRLTVAVDASIGADQRVADDPARAVPDAVRLVGSLGGSAGAVRAICTPEYRKLSASTSSAPGAVRTATSEPPRVRPRTPAERPAAVEQRVRLDVLVRPHQRDDHGGVGDEEQHVERADDERDDVELDERQLPQRVGDRQAEHRGAADPVGHEHRGAAPAAAVDRRTGDQREQQARHQAHRGEQAELLRAGVQHQDGGERDRQYRDLVAEQRDRLALEEQPEVPLPQQLGHLHGVRTGKARFSQLTRRLPSGRWSRPSAGRRRARAARPPARRGG